MSAKSYKEIDSLGGLNDGEKAAAKGYVSNVFLKSLDKRNPTGATRESPPSPMDPFSEAGLEIAISASTNGNKDLAPQRVSVSYLEVPEFLRIPYLLHGSATPTKEILPLIELARVLAAWWMTPILLEAIKQPTKDTDYFSPTNPIVTSKAITLYAAQDGSILNGKEGSAMKIETYLYTFNFSGTNSIECEETESLDSVMTKFAIEFDLNIDIRDFQALAIPNMRMTDDEWSKPLVRDRLRVKLCPWTIYSIADLNLKSVGMNPVLAWARAYMVSIGALHAVTSTHQIEYVYTDGFPSLSNQIVLESVHRSDPESILRISISLAAVFGALHLSRDHTYRPNEPAMVRIGEVFLNCLRTVASNPILEALRQLKKETLRTAMHPFGLAQTYYVHLWGSEFKITSEPLQVRRNITPPPVQRIKIASAALSQIGALPIGELIQRAFSTQTNIIRQAEADINSSPPSYSHLHAHYGIKDLKVVSVEASRAADALMPLVAGFAEAFYIRDAGTANARPIGLALAQSLNNVKRDQAGIVTLYTNLFNDFADRAAKVGLETFIQGQLKQARVLEIAPS